MHKVTKLKINSHGLNKSSYLKIQFLSLMLIGFALGLNAQGMGNMVKLGGAGSVNPLILETFGESSTFVGGTFRGNLEIQALNKSAVGGEDIFISKWENSEISWLQTFGSNDNDAIVDKIWVDTDNSLCIFIVFWDEIEIGGEQIENIYGGKALVAVRLNYFDGEVLSSHLFASQGSLNDVRLSFSDGKCFMGGRIAGSFYNVDDQPIVEDFQGMIVGEVGSDFDFRLIDTVRAQGRQVLSGISAFGDEVLMVGFFNGSLTLGGQVEQTVSVYDNAFSILIDSKNGAGVMRRYGGIFDNNFMRVERWGEEWIISGHFTGVLDLGNGMSLETGNFNSSFVFLRLNAEQEVVEAVQSFGGNLVRNFEMKVVDNNVYFGNQYFNAYEVGAVNISCGTANLASDILYYSEGDFISVENFCFEGNVNNPLYMRGLGDIYSFTTNEGFSYQGVDYEVEGANDGFVFFYNSNSISQGEMKENYVRVFPNPSNGEVNIEVFSDTEIQVYNFQGVLIESISAQAGVSNQFTASQPGIYFIRIAGQEIKKVIVGR